VLRRMGLCVMFAGALTVAPAAFAQTHCEDPLPADDSVSACLDVAPEPVLPAPLPTPAPAKPDPLKLRMLKYSAVAAKHRLCGLASYYSASLDGTLTANGERYRNKRLTAAHLTLPLGCWIEVTARATGKRVRLRVNDRGPYVSKFMLDLSLSAARELGVDVAEDRHVDVRIIALPGEEPLPESVQWAATSIEEGDPALPAAVAAR
jgi:rare lipoprotein A